MPTAEMLRRLRTMSAAWCWLGYAKDQNIIKISFDIE